MPSVAWTPLANITVGASTVSVTFSSISQSYRDLVIVMNAKNSISNDPLFIKINGDTGSNYNREYVYGSGSSASASYGTNSSTGFLSVSAGIGSNMGDSLTTIFDYSATDKHKVWISKTDNADNGVELLSGRWGSTSAITTIQVGNVNWWWAAGGTVALYGVSA